MQKIQFDIRSILILMFVASILLATFSQSNSFVSRILLMVLLANFAGAVTALVVTFVFRIPRDGTLRNKNELETEVPDQTMPGRQSN